jgi:hypothetical protein
MIQALYAHMNNKTIKIKKKKKAGQDDRERGKKREEPWEKNRSI